MFEDILRGAENDPFYYEKSCTPDPNAKWKGPGGGKFAFYTTWSFFAIITVTVFTVIFVPFLFLIPKLSNSEAFSTIGLALIIGFVINSLAVAVCSQFLLNFNWRPLDPDGKRVAADENWIKQLNNINAKVHLLPVILCLFILTIIITVPWKGNKTILYFASCLVPAIFFTIWLCVPVPISKDNPQKTTPFNKVAHVYNYPSGWIMGLLPITVFLTAILYVLAKRNNLYLLKKVKTHIK